MEGPCEPTRNPSAFWECCYLGLSGVGESCKWLRGLDLNQRPLGYEPNELPGCSTPHFDTNNPAGIGQISAASRTRMDGG